MVSTSSAQLLPQDAVKNLWTHLLPVTTVLTLKVPDAKLLLSEAGHKIEDPKCVDDLISIAKAVHLLGPDYVLIKGGHLPLKEDGTIDVREAEQELVVDVLYGNGEVL